MTKLSKRVLEMNESITQAAGARAKALKAEGRDILSLTLGEPDFVTPKNICQKAISSIENGKASFYTIASGMPELKKSYCHLYGKLLWLFCYKQPHFSSNGCKVCALCFFLWPF